MVEKIYRENISALPSKRPLRFEGKADDNHGIKSESVASDIACKSENNINLTFSKELSIVAVRSPTKGKAAAAVGNSILRVI